MTRAEFRQAIVSAGGKVEFREPIWVGEFKRGCVRVVFDGDVATMAEVIEAQDGRNGHAKSVQAAINRVKSSRVFNLGGKD